MSKIGFYRWKIENATTQDVTLYVNNVPRSTKKVIALPVCAGFKMLRWLDKNGQFRFYPFAAEHAIKDKPKQIGEVNTLIGSLLSATSDKRNVGYNNERTLTLRAQRVGAKELELLSEVYTSPRVALYVGDLSTFDEKDWVEVTVSGDGIARREKLKYGLVELTVTLPETYNITMK